jgi:hypothetical protein
MIDSNLFVLGYIAAFFAAFIIPVFGVSIWIAISDLQEQTVARRRERAVGPHGALNAA